MKFFKYSTAFFFITIIFLIFIVTNLQADNIKISSRENAVMNKNPAFTINEFAASSYAVEYNSFLRTNFFLRKYFTELSSVIEKNILLKNNISNVYWVDEMLMAVIKEDPLSEMEKIEKEAKFINQFSKDYSKNGKEVYFFNFPSKAEMYSEEIAKKTAINYTGLNKVLLESKIESSVNYLLPTDKFTEINKETPLYYKTDHHWNHIGAYYGYVQIINKVKNDFPQVGEALKLSDFNITEVSSDFCGSKGRSLGRYNLKSLDSIYKFEPIKKQDIITTEKGKELNSCFYPEYLNNQEYDFYKNQYRYYLSGDVPIIEIVNNSVDNDLTVTVFKDSYMNLANIYLINNFKKVNVIDLRHFKEKDLNEYIDSADLIIFGSQDTPFDVARLYELWDKKEAS